LPQAFLVSSIGLHLGVIASLSGLLGFGGLILAALGYFAFKGEFNAIQVSHFRYVGVVFLAFLVIAMVVSMVFASLTSIVSIFGIILNLASLACMFAGYKMNDKNVAATKENAIQQIKSLNS